MSNNYVVYHSHTDYSLLDSASKYNEYIDKASECGMTAIGFSEHGKLGGIVKKAQYCKERGIKFIYAIECYLTRTLTEKVRDNYHTVLIAKNSAGIKEINKAVTKAFDDEHFYYTMRITFDEFLSLSSNVIATSACLAGPLNKLDKKDPYYEKLLNRYDFLEIQHHNCEDQKNYNIDLACLSEQYHKPLIAGTDTHNVSSYKEECRNILMTYKKQHYDGEEEMDLTWKTYDELVEAYRVQGCLPEKIYLEAIENTNVMASMVEECEFDTSAKYPLLYGSREKDEEELVKLVDRKFKEKVESGAIAKKDIPGFEKAIKEELAVFKKIKMMGFMLSMSEILTWAHSNGIPTGPARGSVGGSRIAYIIDIIDLDPETWHTVFSRFCNEDRVELGDIDTDLIESDRPRVFEYVKNRFGHEKCARVSSFGTLADKAILDTVGGALAEYWSKEHKTGENPYSLEKIKEIKSGYDDKNGEWPEELRKANEKLFYYYDGLKGCKISQSVHPAGMVISPVILSDEYGTFNKDGDDCLFMDMDECHDLGLVKYDFLCLNNVKIINDTFAMAGKAYPKSYEIDWFDEKVWDDMLKSPVGIFQFESSMAFDLLKKMRPKNIFDMSLVTAAVRPSGESYRDDLCAGVIHDNGSEIVNEMLKDNRGWLVYQEDTIKFLQDVCGFTGSEADTVRRAIAKKKLDQVEKVMPKIIDGYCSKSTKSREVAEEEVKQFTQVLIDSASYQFGYNHSVAYCLIGYLCAYLRYYYPLEFITSYLNCAKSQEDIQKGTELAHIYNIEILPAKYGRSKSEYYFDKNDNTISKGIGSIKYMNETVADVLYGIAHTENPKTFMELLKVVNGQKINSRQIEILIKTGFFREFGNINELIQFKKMFELFGEGKAKSVNKEKIKSKLVESIISRHSNGFNKNGTESSAWKFNSQEDLDSCMNECEQLIIDTKLPDAEWKEKVNAYMDYMGYVPATGKDDDRKMLVVLDVTPVNGKNNKVWQYRVDTQSLGSGKTARLSVNPKEFKAHPFEKYDMLKAGDISRDDKGYWHLVSYVKK